MTLDAERFSIRLPRPFRIAHGLSTVRESILVHIYGEDGRSVGHGEGALPPYYPSKAVSCLKWLHEIAKLRNPSAWEAACAKERSADTRAARVALDIALHDLRAGESGKPLWNLCGCDPAQIPPCWRTISIPGNERELEEMLEEANMQGAHRLKLKTGSGDLGWDENCLRLAGERALQLGVDANEGWTPEDAAKIISGLRPNELAFIEQPVPAELSCWVELRSRVAQLKTPPMIADESLQTEQDLVTLKGLADGVNVKLLKAGGFQPARRWIARARELGMRVMLGTMVETGIGRSAAAQLAPLADWLDIDSPESIPAPPMVGFTIEGDQLLLSNRPGLGLRQL